MSMASISITSSFLHAYHKNLLTTKHTITKIVHNDKYTQFKSKFLKLLQP